MTWLRPDIEYDRLGLAPSGFQILGSNAIPAIPALSELAADPSAPGSHGAIIALIGLGPSAVPALSNLLTATVPFPAQLEIRRGLGQMRPRAPAATLALVADLTNPDALAAGESAIILAHKGREFEIVVPALMLALDDSRPQVREQAAAALGHYREAARLAVPKLQKLLGTDPKVDRAARRSLAFIAAEALTNPPPN